MVPRTGRLHRIRTSTLADNNADMGRLPTFNALGNGRGSGDPPTTLAVAYARRAAGRRAASQCRTKTVREDDVFTLPAASCARAVIVAVIPALAEFQTTLYGAVVSLPTTVPPTRKSTFVTATLSLALVLIVVVPETVAPFEGAVSETVGAAIGQRVPALSAQTPGTDPRPYAAA